MMIVCSFIALGQAGRAAPRLATCRPISGGIGGHLVAPGPLPPQPQPPQPQPPLLSPSLSLLLSPLLSLMSPLLSLLLPPLFLLLSPPLLSPQLLSPPLLSPPRLRLALPSSQHPGVFPQGPRTPPCKSIGIPVAMSIGTELTLGGRYMGQIYDFGYRNAFFSSCKLSRPQEEKNYR